MSTTTPHVVLRVDEANIEISKGIRDRIGQIYIEHVYRIMSMKEAHRHSINSDIGIVDVISTGIGISNSGAGQMLPDDAITILKENIEKETKLNVIEAYKLAVWIYNNEHPGFNDEVLA